MFRKEKRLVSPFAIFSFVFTGISLILLFFARSSTDIADFLNGTLCLAARRALAFLGDLIPFSVYELILFLSPVILTFIIAFAVKLFRRGYGAGRFLINIISAVLVLYAGNVICLGISYNTTTVDKEMNFPIVRVTEDSLAELMTALRDEVNLFSADIAYTDDGRSASGYTMDEISERICASYSEFSAEYGFVPDFYSRAKGVGAGSIIMSYLGIGGIYTYFTGEANVNTAYPEYDVVFTAAHELSHQRGVLRENEANFMAYVICSRSDDLYLRYSAALNMYSYIASALYRTNEERYFEIAKGLSEGARADIRASNAVAEKYGNTFIADISSFINDLFLKSNGTDGVVTYGRVVTLAVSYFEANK